MRRWMQSVPLKRAYTVSTLGYTLPLLVGTGLALRAGRGGQGLRANAIGLLLSTAYLGWGAVAQQSGKHVDEPPNRGASQHGESLG